MWAYGKILLAWLHTRWVVSLTGRARGCVWEMAEGGYNSGSTFWRMEVCGRSKKPGINGNTGKIILQKGVRPQHTKLLKAWGKETRENNSCLLGENQIRITQELSYGDTAKGGTRHTSNKINRRIKMHSMKRTWKAQGENKWEKSRSLVQMLKNIHSSDNLTVCLMQRNEELLKNNLNLTLNKFRLDPKRVFDRKKAMNGSQTIHH